MVILPLHIFYKPLRLGIYFPLVSISTYTDLFFCSGAPASALNVLPGQSVELRVANRITEDYISPDLEVAKEDFSPNESSNVNTN